MTPPPAVPAPALRAEVRAAIRAARAGGRAAMRRYGAADVDLKRDGSPVTAADHASQAAVLRVLRAAFPDDAVLSEERADPAERLAARRVWIVDPLDGTKEYLARNGEFAVMVGLAVDGRAVVGAVCLPAHDVTYAAAEGLGARLGMEGRWRRLVAPRAPDGPPRLVGSRSHPDGLLARIQSRLRITDVLPAGSVGLKCALVAEGERDLYVHPVPYLREWDTCAPEVVLREAGGTVTDCRGEPLVYNKPDPVQPHGILAAAPGVAERVGATVAAVYAAAGRGA
ncbi:MAG TPA: 3'(2'),5'-bisphosphate nucleotidase CysQ [Longimicrobium sp.]|nr:3'(2'),5'-bisphosphate nucleotidase CysQ [Longimicrobium sp.]